MIDIVLLLYAIGFFAFIGFLIWEFRKGVKRVRQQMLEARQRFAKLSPEEQKRVLQREKRLMRDLDRENAELMQEDSEGDGLMLGLGSMFPPEEDEDDP